MPNYTTNRLTIEGTEEQIKEVLDFIKIEKEEEGQKYGIGIIDFNKITPMPKWVFAGNLLGEEEKEKYGEENCWNGWCSENWGTKWNARDQGFENNNTIYFNTAWNNVLILIGKLTWIFPDITFEYGWSNEGVLCNAVRVRIKDGEIIDKDMPERNTKEAYTLECYIFGSEPSDDFEAEIFVDYDESDNIPIDDPSIPF